MLSPGEHGPGPHFHRVSSLPSRHCGRGEGSAHVLGLRGPGGTAVSVGQGEMDVTPPASQAISLQAAPWSGLQFPQKASESPSFPSCQQFLSPSWFLKLLPTCVLVPRTIS